MIATPSHPPPSIKEGSPTMGPSNSKSGATQSASGNAAHPQPRKKMYRNCDTCRAAKRGCDANYSTIAEALAKKVACTNCRKKGQRCTFDSLIQAFGGIPLGDLASTITDNHTSGSNTESNSKRPRSDDGEEDTSELEQIVSHAVLTGKGPPQAKRPRSESASESSSDVTASDLLADTTITTSSALTPIDRSHQAFQDFSIINLWGTSPNVRLSDSIDRLHLNEDLLNVYEGAAESAFRCWVTNATTPYLLTPETFSGSLAGGEHLHRKVCTLDQRSQRFLRSTPHTKASERRVSEAYQAVLLAYAAQWPRHRQNQGGDLVPNTEWKPDEARIRMALWKQARDKLMDAADAWSFRIIFALILFAWTEKPKEVPEEAHWGQEHDEFGEPIQVSPLNENSALDSSAWQTPAEASTMMLATAMRKLKSFRIKLQDLQRKGINPWSTDEPGMDMKEIETRKSEAALLERTYHNLFWLGVMMDTEIAVLRKHAPIIGDDDTDLTDMALTSPWSNSHGDHLNLPGAVDMSLPSIDPSLSAFRGDGQKRNIWDEVIPSNSQLNRASFAKQWPCSESDALRTLAYATPIKVLLFRHVSRLQEAYWRQSPSHEVERRISHVLSVIRHWDETFAPFIASCLAHHAELPPSVQSWYTITVTKWNLASILLVELVQSVDRSASKWFRQGDEAFEQLRRKVCNETAALIHAIQHTRLADDSAGGSSPLRKSFDFIRATDSTILHTDPWTEITVHCFTAVSKSEIRTFNSLASVNKWQELECAEHRVEKCIWALEQLSNRSTLADDACKEMKELMRNHSPSWRLKKDGAVGIDSILAELPSFSVPFAMKDTTAEAPVSACSASGCAPSMTIPVVPDVTPAAPCGLQANTCNPALFSGVSQQTTEGDHRQPHLGMTEDIWQNCLQLLQQDEGTQPGLSGLDDLAGGGLPQPKPDLVDDGPIDTSWPSNMFPGSMDMRRTSMWSSKSGTGSTSASSVAEYLSTPESISSLMGTSGSSAGSNSGSAAAFTVDDILH